MKRPQSNSLKEDIIDRNSGKNPESSRHPRQTAWNVSEIGRISVVLYDSVQFVDGKLQMTVYVSVGGRLLD